MKKNDLFTFTAPNGVEVTAVVLHVNIIHEDNDGMMFEHICYAQNRIFTYIYTERTLPVCIGQDEYGDDRFEYQDVKEYQFGKVIVDYAILPDYDTLLERYNDIQVAQTETSLGM